MSKIILANDNTSSDYIESSHWMYVIDAAEEFGWNGKADNVYMTFDDDHSYGRCQAIWQISKESAHLMGESLNTFLAVYKHTPRSMLPCNRHYIFIFASIEAVIFFCEIGEFTVNLFS